MPSFPYITAFVKHASQIAIAAALVIGLLGLYAAWRLALPELFAVGLIFAGAAYLGLRLLGEIVLAIAETLLPR